MAPNLIQLIRAKIDFLRLENRYTRSRERRTAFRSDAYYDNGEYYYKTAPHSPASSSLHSPITGSGSSSPASTIGVYPSGRVNALHGTVDATSPREILDQHFEQQQYQERQKRQSRQFQSDAAETAFDFGTSRSNRYSVAVSSSALPKLTPNPKRMSVRW